MKKAWGLFNLIIMILVLAVPAVALETGAISDPLTIGVGARALGMGRAYVAMAEGADAVFVNPASIATCQRFSFSSMYSSFLNDVSYIVLGGVYPLDKKSAVGAGYVSANTSDIMLTSGTGQNLGTATWGNSVFFLSYGTNLNILPFFNNVNDGVLVGTSLKYYLVGGTGNQAIVRASGGGLGADLGLLVPVTPYLAVGANFQNLLGGQITKASGYTESMASNLKVGTKINLMGRDIDSLYAHPTQRLYADFDYDLSNSKGEDMPHLGLEFWPQPNMALRCGLDNTNITAGVGVRFSGLEFNFAYHPYGGLSDDNTYFFSISYLGEAPARQFKLELSENSDKTITNADKVLVSGRLRVLEGEEAVAPDSKLQVTIDGKEIPLDKNLSFCAELPLKELGKNSFVLEATDGRKKLEEPIRVVRLIEFQDVPTGYWAKRPIDESGTVSLVNGYPDGTFRPEDCLTRAELATLLVRAKGLQLPPRQAKKIFKDVSPSSWAANYIEGAYMAGMLKGYPDGSFKPNQRVTRAEGIALLARFDKLTMPTTVTDKPYNDVATQHWAAPYLTAAKQAGLLSYITTDQLKPSQYLGRAETVEMLVKTQTGGEKVQDLYSWDKIKTIASAVK